MSPTAPGSTTIVSLSWCFQISRQCEHATELAGRVLDRAELAARPVDRAAGGLVAADEDVEPAVTVDVVERGRRPHGVLDVVAHDLVAVAVDRVDVQVEPAEDDVGEAVAVDVADGRRRVHAVGVAVGVRIAVPDVEVVARCGARSAASRSAL